MVKNFGMYTLCYDTAKWTPKQFKLLRIWTAFCNKSDTRPLIEKAGQLQTYQYGDGREKIMEAAKGWRIGYAYDRKFSRCHRFKTFCVVHECDGDGIWKPTKKELEEAEQFHEFLELHK